MRLWRACPTIGWKEAAMKIRNLMTNEVVTVAPETSLKEAATILVHCRISGVPVVDVAGTVVGVFSEADIVFHEGGERHPEGLLGRLFEREFRLEDRLMVKTVGDAMTTPAITISPDAPVHKAAARMMEYSIKRLPVVEDGTLIGIVTRADLVRAFVRSDVEIAEEIRSEILRRTLWLEPGAVTIRVSNGAVELAGQVETETDAELLPHFVERVPGVTSVRTTLGIEHHAHAQ